MVQLNDNSQIDEINAWFVVKIRKQLMEEAME
jgi:hypothetical protein